MSDLTMFDIDPDADPTPYVGGLPDHPAGDPEQSSAPQPNEKYIPTSSLADENPYYDGTAESRRAPITTAWARPGVPLIAVTGYPGRLIDARTISLSTTNPLEMVGYRGGAPNPGIQITVVQYLDANPTGIAEIIAEGMEASTLAGFTLVPGEPIILPVSRLTLRLNSVGTGTFVRVGVLVIANDREP